MKNITGKKILVIGATGGFGSVISKTLDEYGAILFLHGNKESEKLNKLQSSLKNVDGTVLADITKEQQVENMYSEVVKAWNDKLDGLVISSGSTPVATEIKDTSLEDWNYAINVNLTGPFLLIKHASPLLKKAGGGKIVVISSIFGIETPLNRGSYGAAKHGLTALVQTVSKEEGASPNIIHINALCPGSAYGENAERAFERTAKEKGISVDEFLKIKTSKIPAGRLLYPGEVAEATAFLCSDSSNYINGELIKLTGGAIE